NGVGVHDGHIVVFAISDDPVTFYQFATLFRDRLNCPNALFLDGSVSSLYAPAVGRDDALLPLGPIVGVINNGLR
ncbi:MAG TPA: phosphodiester glycosidase family protein, partial [Methylovirgula sp.]